MSGLINANNAFTPLSAFPKIEINQMPRLVVCTKKCLIFSFMKYILTEIKGGTVTSPLGFLAGATEAAVKYKGRLIYY